MARKNKKDDSGGHLVATVASTGAALAMRKLLITGWTKVTGKAPPIDLTDPRVTLVEALAWAVLLSVSIEAARFYIIRATAKRSLPEAGETE